MLFLKLSWAIQRQPGGEPFAVLPWSKGKLIHTLLPKCSRRATSFVVIVYLPHTQEGARFVSPKRHTRSDPGSQSQGLSEGRVQSAKFLKNKAVIFLNFVDLGVLKNWEAKCSLILPFTFPFCLPDGCLATEVRWVPPQLVPSHFKNLAGSP